ncbi:MAG: hypothetical protein EOM91_06260 [Sphingobacteriia bacterium]|nr:hypothetical protein [Sphingobacteriia bacterium]NCC37842.1 hypothetical protein [Gammaproteobacteria bacterium]
MTNQNSMFGGAAGATQGDWGAGDPRAMPLPETIEQSWRTLNHGLLAAAGNADLPLTTRVARLAEVESNLDALLGLHVGELKRQIAAGIRLPGADPRPPTEQLTATLRVAHEIRSAQESLYQRLQPDLARAGLHLLAHAELSQDSRDWLRGHFSTEILPLLTPLAIDPALPFPYISDSSLNLLIGLRYPDESMIRLARIRLPTQAGACKRLVGSDVPGQLVLLEDLITANLDLLFPGMEISSSALFRITRERRISEGAAHGRRLDAESTNETLPLAVHLEVQATMTPAQRGMLAAELGLSESREVVKIDGLMGLSDLRELADVASRARVRHSDPRTLP